MLDNQCRMNNRHNLKQGIISKAPRHIWNNYIPQCMHFLCLLKKTLNSLPHFLHALASGGEGGGGGPLRRGIPCGNDAAIRYKTTGKLGLKKGVRQVDDR